MQFQRYNSPFQKQQILEKKQMPLKCTEDTSYLRVGYPFLFETKIKMKE